MIKEIRLLSPYSLRGLCIRNNWYTAGTNDEYNHLLCDLTRDGKAHMTTDDLRKVAEDIMKHSHLPKDYDLFSVMYDVCDVTITVFSED